MRFLLLCSIYSFGFYVGYEGTNGSVVYAVNSYQWRDFSPSTCPATRNSDSIDHTCLQVFSFVYFLALIVIIIVMSRFIIILMVGRHFGHVELYTTTTGIPPSVLGIQKPKKLKSLCGLMCIPLRDNLVVPQGLHIPFLFITQGNLWGSLLPTL